MKFIHALFDLPWWTGLPIFLLSNLLIPMGLGGYIAGCIGFLFGAWIFSKLVNYTELPDTYGEAIIGFIVFFASMYFFASKVSLPPLSLLETNGLYVTRTVLGLASSLVAFEGFKHK